MTQYCPICRAEVPRFDRYPHYLCKDCAALAADRGGRALRFGNLSAFGGYWARYADSDEVYDSHVCFVKGVECRANEARFGGIVIEALPPPGATP